MTGVLVLLKWDLGGPRNADTMFAKTIVNRIVVSILSVFSSAQKQLNNIVILFAAIWHQSIFLSHQQMSTRTGRKN